MTIRVRRFVCDDTAACTEIFDRAWHAGHPHAPRQIDRAALERNLRGETVLVAEAEPGRVVGFVSVYEPRQFIHNLYVEPAAHRQGIGRALLAAAVRLAGGRASLKCQKRNAGALGFYRHLGWTDGEEGRDGGEAWIRLHSPRVSTSARQSDPRSR